MTTGELSLADAITLDRVSAERAETVVHETPLVSTPVRDVDEFLESVGRFAMDRYAFRLPMRADRV